jgi:cobalt-zinc-cadmium resistance protein CzcA
MQGTGADDVRYTASTRFQSAQLGMGIPLFFGAQKARIAAARRHESMAAGDWAIARQQLQQEYQTAWIQYQKNREALHYYEHTVLPHARQITATLNLQLSKGAINYLEWTLLNNQAVSIQSAYLDAVKNLNESIIQLNYLMNS